MDGPADDLALLQRWREGDAVAGELLVRRHIGAIHRFFATKGVDDIVDLVQRTFVACLERRGQPGEVGNFRGWVFGIARHLLLERWSARGGFDPATSSLAQLGPSASSLLVLAEDQRRLTHALWRIPIDAQIVLELYYWEGVSTRGLAEVLAIPEPTARRRLQRAREALLDAFDASPGSHDDGTIEQWIAALGPQLPGREQ